MQDAGENVLQKAPDALTSLTRLMEAFVELLEKLIKENREAKLAKEMLSYVKKGGNLQCFLNKDYSVKDLDRELEILGVEHMTMRITDGPYKGLIGTYFKEEDLEKALIAKERALARGRGRPDGYGNIMRPATEVSLSTIGNMSMLETGGNVTHEIHGLNEAKAQFLTSELRSLGITFAREEYRGKDNLPRTNFHFAITEDMQKIQAAYARMQYEFLGLSGNYRHQAIMNDIRQVNKAIEAMKESGKEFYLVSQNNPKERIHVTDSSVAHVIDTPNGLHSYRTVDNYDHAGLERVYKQEASCMKNPVVLSKEEYMAAKDDPVTMQELLQSKTQGIVYASEAEKIQAYEEKEYKNLFNQRMYARSRDGSFDLAKEVKQFEKLKAGTLSLTDYLSDGLSAVESRAVEATVRSFSSEEQERLLSFIESGISGYEQAGQEVCRCELTKEQLQKDLDTIAREAVNKATFTERIPEKEYNEHEYAEQDIDDEE